MCTKFTSTSFSYSRICYIWIFSLCLLSISMSTDVTNVPILQMTSEGLSTTEFVELSYQPLQVSDALTEATTTTLAPWHWPQLRRWVDAAITFTTSFSSKIYCKDSATRPCPGKVMSLRKFSKCPAKKCTHAVTNITAHMGSSIGLPSFLADADFTFLDFTRTSLHHGRRGWTDHEEAMPSTSVVCGVEGRLKTMFKPFQVSWDKLKVEFPSVFSFDEDVSEEEKKLLVILTGELNPRDCIYIPQGWSWKFSALEDATFFWLVWDEDLILLEDALDTLVIEVDEDIEGSEVQDHIEKASDEKILPERNQPQRVSGKLSEYLPTNLKKKENLWSSPHHFRHVINRYLLTEKNLNKDDFIRKFKSDRILFEHLVDCSTECEALVKNIFNQLDSDGNGVLTQDDADTLVPKSYRSIMHELDDLVDELSDVAMDQWKDYVKGDEGSRGNFMERARSRIEESGKSYLERWKHGDMEPEEEAALKENMPELYEEIIAYRESGSKKDEL